MYEDYSHKSATTILNNSQQCLHSLPVQIKEAEWVKQYGNMKVRKLDNQYQSRGKGQSNDAPTFSLSAAILQTFHNYKRQASHRLQLFIPLLEPLPLTGNNRQEGACNLCFSWRERGEREEGREGGREEGGRGREGRREGGREGGRGREGRRERGRDMRQVRKGRGRREGLRRRVKGMGYGIWETVN